MSSAQGPGQSRSTNLAALGLCALVLAACWPALFGGFVWDDSILAEATVVREWSGLWHIWFSPESIRRELHYWPIPYTSFWLEHKLWGLSAFSTHLVNILLHVANTLLLWRILIGLGVPGAWLAAAVFAVHPVHIEAVAWIIERKDLLAVLFYLWAVHVWLRFHSGATGAPPGMRHHVLLAVLLLAALWSKTIAVTLPVALLLLHWWQQGRVSRRVLLGLMPLFVLTALAIALDLYIYWPVQEGLDLDYSLLERVLIAAQSLCFYLGKLLWPLDLAVIYPHWHVGGPESWLSLLAVVLVALLLGRYRHRGRGPAAAMLFFVLALSPVLGFMDFSYMKFSFAADRYQYLASIGPLVLIVGAGVRLARAVAASGSNRRLVSVLAPRMAVLGVASMLGVLIWLSTQQAALYQDEVRFFRHILAHNPQAKSAHLNLGAALLRQGDMQAALQANQAALIQAPDAKAAPYIRHNVGMMLLSMGRYQEAIQPLREALQNDDSEGAIVSHHQKMAEQALREDRHEAAIILLRVLTEDRPEQAQAWASLGEALWRTGQYTEAISVLEQASALDAKAPAIHVLIALSAEALDQTETAVQHYTQALALDPDFLPALEHLGHLQFASQQYSLALASWQRLVALTPDRAEAHFRLGTVLAELGQTQAARQSLQQALALDPGLGAARTRLRELQPR